MSRAKVAIHIVRPFGRLSAPSVVTAVVAATVCGGLVLQSPLWFRSGGDSLAGYLSEEWASTDPGADVRVPRLADTVIVRGVIHSTLYDAVRHAGARALPRAGTAELAWRLADVFEYRVDMSHDLAPGDEFRLLVERALRPDGSVYAADLLAARLVVSGAPIEAVRARRGTYVDRSGRSLRARFLRAPLSFRRMSSPFGVRWHPVRGGWREHRGIDYAAAAGTPVRSVGDGVVIFAGYRGTYGNLVEVRHPGGIVTRYAHLRAYGRRVRRGTRVRVGETVGFVGSTGLSTGPHLHFEMLVNGRYTDPRRVLASRHADGFRLVDRTAYGGVRRAALLRALGA